jgi:magnesium-transporting ATPase (P-type)
MTTGDNMLTAISVAHDCKMVGLTDKIVHVEAHVSTKDSNLPQMWFVLEDDNAKIAKENLFNDVSN